MGGTSPDFEADRADPLIASNKMISMDENFYIGKTKVWEHICRPHQDGAHDIWYPSAGLGIPFPASSSGRYFFILTYF